MYQGFSTPKVGVIFEEIRVLLSSSKTKALIQKSLGGLLRGFPLTPPSEDPPTALHRQTTTTPTPKRNM